MWRDANYNATSGWVWIDDTYSYDPSGGEQNSRTEYEDLKLWTVRDDIMMRNRKNGVTKQGMLYAVIPKFTLEEWDLTPTLNHTFLKSPQNITYKVIGILDLTHDPDYFCYYLTLKREEI